MRKKQFSNLVITKQLWASFRKNFPEYKDMNWSEFYDNWMNIAETIRNEAVTNPLGVKLGSYSGELKVQYLPYRSKKASLHLESNGKVATLKWERKWAGRFNKILTFYAFTEARELNKMAYNYIRKNPNKIRVGRTLISWKDKIRKNEQ